MSPSFIAVTRPRGVYRLFRMAPIFLNFAKYKIKNWGVQEEFNIAYDEQPFLGSEYNRRQNYLVAAFQMVITILSMLYMFLSAASRASAEDAIYRPFFSLSSADPGGNFISVVRVADKEK